MQDKKNQLILRKTGLRLLNEEETAQVGSGLVPADSPVGSSGCVPGTRLPPQKITWAKCPGAYSGGCPPV
jgi:hypothetical protein